MSVAGQAQTTPGWDCWSIGGNAASCRGMSAIPDLWHPETVYLNTASFGLPPDPVWDALQVAQTDWRHGRVSWEHWTAVTGRARAQYARLVGVEAERVATGATVSGLIALVA